MFKIILTILIFSISSIFIIYGSIIQHSYIKEESFFEFLWFITMDYIIICIVGIGCFICLPILLFV